MSSPYSSEFVRRVFDRLMTVRTEIETFECSHDADSSAAAAEHRASARNLLHYVGLRSRDLRDLQADLSHLGLSSLGRTEAHVLAGIDGPLRALCRIEGRDLPEGLAKPPVDYETGPAALEHHADLLFGPPPRGRSGRVMVTAGTEVADDPDVARRLVEAGMDLLRINAAHDDEAAWRRMLVNVRAAAECAGRRVRVLFDLAGPKLRTGAVEEEEDVVHWRPKHDVRGAVIAPARVRLVAAGAPATRTGVKHDVVLPVDPSVVKGVAVGDRIVFDDCRKRERMLAVAEPDGAGGWIALCDAGAYVEAGVEMIVLRGGDALFRGRTGPFPPRPADIELKPGDVLLLTAGVEPGRPARRAFDGSVLEPARIPCTLSEVFPAAKKGERIWFDDGKIGGVIEEAGPSVLRVRIKQAKPDGSTLAEDKGINLPDTAIALPALTAKDLADLDFAAKCVDMIGLSFVRSEQDVLELERELDRRHAQHLGLVLKIENARAFERLPRILLAALRSPPVGVMIARGDLAVEVGFERLAEVQEEILWLCEAAHVPVIWATQVLETLSKKGAPSRAEVTDAAMSGRAECVMLNKGPHADMAVRFLDDVLRRMAAHQHKKRPMLRRLGVSRVD